MIKEKTKWKWRSVESLCSNVTSGGTPSRSNPDFYKDGQIPWLKTKELKGYYIHDSEEKITEQALAKSSAKLFPAETVLMAMYGDGRTITSLGILKNEAATNQACCAMIPDPAKCDPKFLLYSLSSNKDRLLKLAIGGAQRNLSGKIIREFEILAPPVSTQRKIAGILSAYDDLIDNNLRRIKIHEEMAQSLYREWFVHFRFPGHESARFIDSSIGQIPKGWDIGKLEDVLVLQRGFDLPKAERDVGDIPIYAASGITGYHSESKVKGPGIVTGRSGTIGQVVYIHEDFWPLNTALWVKAFPRSEPLYAYFVLSSIDLKGFNSGAAVPTLNRNDIHSLETLIPPIALQSRFQENAGAMLAQARILTLSIQNLRRTRDLLLPKLLSGDGASFRAGNPSENLEKSPRNT